MEKMEKKLTKNKLSVASIVASILLLTIVFIGASYAFFSDTLIGTNESIKFGNGLNVSFILSADKSIDFDFNPLEMTDNTTDNTYIDSESINGTVTLTNNSDVENVTCEYEIWYHADQVFTNNDKQKDITLISKESDNSSDNHEVNLNDVKTDTDTKIADEHITVTSSDEDKTKTQNWTFNFRHYILKDQSQNEHLGQKFSGKVYFKAKDCYEGTYKGN